MDDWELVVEDYPAAADLRKFSKMLNTVEVALNGDLAPFEFDWIINTLFYKPINLFETMTANCQDNQWIRPICDAFKLITFIVEKYPVDYENIVTLCLQPYIPQIRKDALKCLTAVARVSAEAGRDIQRLVSELEDIVTSKAPLAVLIGTIAEYHPELVADEIHRIWRLYLNMLDSNKNTVRCVPTISINTTSVSISEVPGSISVWINVENELFYNSQVWVLWYHFCFRYSIIRGL
ncbi:unnamed protein product [Diatraea saccharalis]|uniref:Uncharacterized protein n=1 Tax=Diatraea saccharalis TaxID=40085 RepID=A0A9N9WD20_9NEOP|nr:unnamed protein product [Diatraea saccharalis]